MTNISPMAQFFMSIGSTEVPERDSVDQELHSDMLDKINNTQVAISEYRVACLEDRRFCDVSGAQWEGLAGLEGNWAGRPRMEVNLVQKAVKRIIGECRNSEINIVFIPRDGDDRDGFADTCSDILRSDMNTSRGREAQHIAFQEQVTGGMGAIRVCAEYSDDDDEDEEEQNIRLVPIPEADSCVYFDLNAKLLDKSDAEYAFILHAITREVFEKEYPDKSYTTCLRQSYRGYSDTSFTDQIYIAEFYKKVSVRDTIRYYLDPTGVFEEKLYVSDIKEDPNVEKSLLDRGFRLLRTKKTKKTRVRKYVLSGGDILEDEGFLPGCNIPIIPFYGHRVFIDGYERFHGLVRFVIDVCRLYNMQISALSEISSFPPERPVFTPEQMAGLEDFWRSEAQRNAAYLLINRERDRDGSPIIAPIDYVRPPTIPPAMSALLQVCDIMTKELTGLDQPHDQVDLAKSGKAIQLLQSRADMYDFIFLDNYSTAMRRVGEVWFEMAKDLYVKEGRALRAVSRDGGTRFVKMLSDPMFKENTTEYSYKNDFSTAKFDVDVSVGPSFSSKKEGVVNSLVQVLQMAPDPETQGILTSLILTNMEGEGLKEMREFYRKKLVAAGVIPPNDQEKQELQAQQASAAQAQQNDPNLILSQAAAQQALAQAEQARAQAQKAKADSILSLAKAEQAKAEAEKTTGELSMAHREEMFNMMDRISAPMKQNT